MIERKALFGRGLGGELHMVRVRQILLDATDTGTRWRLVLPATSGSFDTSGW